MFPMCIFLLERFADKGVCVCVGGREAKQTIKEWKQNYRNLQSLTNGGLELPQANGLR